MNDLTPEHTEVRAGSLELARQAVSSRRLFVVAWCARMLIVLAVCFSPGDLLRDLSSDSDKYHDRGIVIAAEFARGEIDWASWIDDGWYQFVGLVYFVCGPHLVVVMAVNAVLAACATVLIYRIALTVFRNEPVARMSGYIFALFPSIVYYTAMPLKEAASLYGLLGIVWGVVSLLERRGHRGMLWIAGGLAILASLRVYMFFVCAGCAAVCLIPVRIARGWAGAFQVASVLLAGGLSAFFVADAAGIRQEEHESLRYFDVEYINSVRVGLTERGNAKMYQDAEQAAFGQGWTNDLKLAGNGIFYFLFSIDLANVTRARQLAAVPEMLFIFYCLPYLLAGAIRGWNQSPRMALPVLLFGVVIAGVFTSAATNMGALYRWRAQALPFLIMLIVFGAAARRRGMLWTMLRRLHVRRQIEARAHPLTA